MGSMSSYFSQVYDILVDMGWEFVQIDPSEWVWKKFDAEGNLIAVQGDKTWILDASAASAKVKGE